MEEILSIAVIGILSAIVFLMILYYVNRKKFNSILRDIAGKIDPDGETPPIDGLPTLPKREKPAFKQIKKTTPFQTKLLRTPMVPRNYVPSERIVASTNSKPKKTGRFASSGNRISNIFD